jgi:hypothetical protein
MIQVFTGNSNCASCLSVLAIAHMIINLHIFTIAALTLYVLLFLSTWPSTELGLAHVSSFTIILLLLWSSFFHFTVCDAQVAHVDVHNHILFNKIADRNIVM